MSKQPNKVNNLILAILAFLLAMLVCAFPLSQALGESGKGSQGWLIGLAIALALGTGMYFLYDNLQKRRIVQQDKISKEIFTPILPSGETLLAFVQGYTGPRSRAWSSWAGLVVVIADAIVNKTARKEYYVGVTDHCLILIQVNGKQLTGIQQIFERNEINEVSFESGLFKEPKLIITFPSDRMELNVETGDMIKLAKEVDSAWNTNTQTIGRSSSSQTSNLSNAEARAEGHLIKALNFQGMGLLASAEHEQELARQMNPQIITDTRYQAIQTRNASQQAESDQWKLPTRIAAGMLIVDILILLLQELLVLNEGNLNKNLGGLVLGLTLIVVNAYLAFNLLRLKDKARRAVLSWAVILIILHLGSYLPGLVEYIGFSGSLFILLLGKPSRIRIGLALGIFLVVYIGVLFGGIAQALTNSLH